MERSTLANGLTIWNMVKAVTSGKMEDGTSVTMIWTKSKAMVFIDGLMEEYT